MAKDKDFEFINEAAKKSFFELPKAIISQFGSDLNAVQQNRKPFSDFKPLNL